MLSSAYDRAKVIEPVFMSTIRHKRLGPGMCEEGLLARSSCQLSALA